MYTLTISNEQMGSYVAFEENIGAFTFTYFAKVNSKGLFDEDCVENSLIKEVIEFLKTKSQEWEHSNDLFYTKGFTLKK